MNFGRIIRILRRHHGITQIELSKKAGISQGALSKIERGELDLTIESMINIFYMFNNWKGSRK